MGVAVALPPPVDVAPAVHVYVVAPVAVRLAVCPEQIVSELTNITGKGLTVTVDTAVFVQVLEVPVTV